MTSELVDHLECIMTHTFDELPEDIIEGWWDFILKEPPQAIKLIIALINDPTSPDDSIPEYMYHAELDRLMSKYPGMTGDQILAMYREHSQR